MDLRQEIKENYAELVATLKDAGGLASTLYADKVIDRSETNDVMSESDYHKQSEKLLDYILQKDDSCLLTFRDELEKNHPRAYTLLQAKMNQTTSMQERKVGTETSEPALKLPTAIKPDTAEGMGLLMDLRQVIKRNYAALVETLWDVRVLSSMLHTKDVIDMRELIAITSEGDHHTQNEKLLDCILNKDLGCIYMFLHLLEQHLPRAYRILHDEMNKTNIHDTALGHSTAGVSTGGAKTREVPALTPDTAQDDSHEKEKKEKLEMENKLETFKISLKSLQLPDYIQTITRSFLPKVKVLVTVDNHHMDEAESFFQCHFQELWDKSVISVVGRRHPMQCVMTKHRSIIMFSEHIYEGENAVFSVTDCIGFPNYIQKIVRNEHSTKIQVFVDKPFLVNAKQYFLQNYKELWNKNLLQVLEGEPVEYLMARDVTSTDIACEKNVVLRYTDDAEKEQDADVQDLHPFYVKKESAHDEESSVQQTEPEQDVNLGSDVQESTDSDVVEINMEEKYEQFWEKLEELISESPEIQGTYFNQKWKKIVINVDHADVKATEGFFEENFSDMWEESLLEVVGQQPFHYYINMENTAGQDPRGTTRCLVEAGCRIMAVPPETFAENRDRILNREISLADVCRRFYLPYYSGSAGGFVHDAKGDAYLLTALHVLRCPTEVNLHKNERSRGNEQESPDVRPKESMDIRPKESADVRPKESQVVRPKGSPDVRPKESLDVRPKESQDVRPKESPDVRPKESPDVGPKESLDVIPKESLDVIPKESLDVRPKESPDVRPKESQDVRPKESQDVRPKESPDVIPKESPDVIPKESPDVIPKDSPDVRPKENPNVRPKICQLPFNPELNGIIKSIKSISLKNEKQKCYNRTSITSNPVIRTDSAKMGIVPESGSAGGSIPVITEVLESNNNNSSSCGKIYHIGSETFGFCGVYNVSEQTRTLLDFSLVKITEEVKNCSKLCPVNSSGERVELTVFRKETKEMYKWKVEKEGAQTGHTTGTVLPIMFDLVIDNKRCEDTFHVISDNDKPFSVPGDSGSSITSIIGEHTTGEVYGLLVGGVDEYTHLSDEGRVTYTNMTTCLRLDHCFQFAASTWGIQGLQFFSNNVTF